jgi:hypothetical protein
MNRATVLAELSPDHRQWLTRHGSPSTWEATARDVAVSVGRRLLINNGGCGWDRVTHALLVRDASPAVRACATALGCDPYGRRWSVNSVVKVLQSHFGLHSAYKRLYRDCSASFGELAADAA